jgi:hypothetical protein
MGILGGGVVDTETVQGNLVHVGYRVHVFAEESATGECRSGELRDTHFSQLRGSSVSSCWVSSGSTLNL